jgi:hypothetical protein
MNSNIKKFFHLSIFGITMISGAVFAQSAPEPNWVLMDSTDITENYIDKTSLKRNGDNVMLWESFVLKKDKTSAKILKEFNCKTKQHRTLSGTFYSKINFTGDTMALSKKDWEYVTRGSYGEDILEYACKNAPKGLMDYFK